MTSTSGPAAGESAAASPAACFNQLFLVPGSSVHVVAISSQANQVSVFSVSPSSDRIQPVRHLLGINGPQNVCMVTRHKALILCADRQLKLYDLDQGKLLIRLKGVMNQKMPFFASIDERNCITLSRNRMTANIMSLETGDLTTTFKVGEDRFLNSLLVSGDGSTCVCGDETQKPFPLLVWDLAARKLLYDLRLQHHNFLTHMSAISHDAHYVLSVAEEVNSSAPNFLVVYDLASGMLFKKWKPGIDSTAVCIRGKVVVNACADNSILVWDLGTGDRRFKLEGHTAPVDRLHTSDNEADPRLLSYNSTGADPVIRVWDLETGQLVRDFRPEGQVTCCLLTVTGQQVVYSVRHSLQVSCFPVSGSASTTDEAEVEAFGDVENEGKSFRLEN